MSEHSHQHPPAERQAFILRARRVEGQLKAIERMLADDRDCAEVLMQIISARKGLKALAEKLIHSHLHHCIEDAKNSSDAQQRLHALLEVLERYVD